MGVGSRVFRTFLCDGCGREVIAEEDSSVDGYFLEAMQEANGVQTGSENIYACSARCIEQAVRDGLRRESLPEEQKLKAIQELWLRGRIFCAHPTLPVYDAGDQLSIIGTAQEIENYVPDREGRK